MQYPQAFWTIAQFDHLIPEIHNSREASGKHAAYYWVKVVDKRFYGGN